MKRPGCVFFAVLIGLSAFTGVVKMRSDLQRATTRFGQPTPDLTLWTRWRLSHTLIGTGDALFVPTSRTVGAVFMVAPGESATTIARRLQQQGLIPDATAFLAYLRYKGWDTDLQAGEFHLRQSMSPAMLAEALRQRPPTSAVLVILPGWRREEVAAALPSSGLTSSPAQFLQATAGRGIYALPFTVPAEASLEGFLAPGRYTFSRDTGIEEIVAAMLARAASFLTPDWQKAVRNRGLTPYQGLILASIVQRETQHPDEMPRIAAVYLNRLHRAMLLEADPTVQYALGKPDAWWPSPLSAADLRTPSPYNTYLHRGLPPGPIANPSAEALHAVATAPQTDDLFFRAACDGSGRHVFFHTFREHLSHACP